MSTYRPTELSIPVDDVELPAKLALPEGTTALIVFAPHLDSADEPEEAAEL
jgi:hypothetical protein